MDQGRDQSSRRHQGNDNGGLDRAYGGGGIRYGGGGSSFRDGDRPMYHRDRGSRGDFRGGRGDRGDRGGRGDFRGGDRRGGGGFRGNGSRHMGFNRDRPSNRRDGSREKEAFDKFIPKQNLDSFEKIKKDFYVENDMITKRSEEENQKYMLERCIKAFGNKVPKPVQTFEESSLPKYLVDQCSAQFKEPSAIQSQAWPVALQGRDLIGIAQTGSGKTLSFILPGIVHVMAQSMIKKGDGPIVLVMAPTRELAMQIEQETSKFARICQLTSLAIYGGVPRHEQSSKLHNGVEILIATPGRLLDFLESGDTNLNRVTYLALDEADRMLDMGFEKDIKRIVQYIQHPDRQTLMFSATWPPEIQDLASNICSMAPIHIQIGGDNQNQMEGGLTVNENISQTVHVLTNNYEKYQRLTDLLMKLSDGNKVQQKIIIFCQTKIGVDTLEKSLRNDDIIGSSMNFEVRGIHGDKQQYQRDEIYRRFKIPLTDSFFETQQVVDGKLMQGFRVQQSNILLATDVASRGLDVKDITVVLNYDMPNTIEDYVHRIGRTGRAGAKGIAHSFITSKELSLAPDLIKILAKTNQEIPRALEDLAQLSLQTKAENKYRQWRKKGDNGGMRNFNPNQMKSQAVDGNRGVPQFSDRPAYATQNPVFNYNSLPATDDQMNKRDQKAFDRPMPEKFTQQDFKQELFGAANIQNPASLINYQHPAIQTNQVPLNPPIVNPEPQQQPLLQQAQSIQKAEIEKSTDNGDPLSKQWGPPKND